MCKAVLNLSLPMEEGNEEEGKRKRRMKKERLEGVHDGEYKERGVGGRGMERKRLKGGEGDGGGGGGGGGDRGRFSQTMKR